MRELLVTERAPDGFNIGINDGAAAGQTAAAGGRLSEYKFPNWNLMN